MNDNQRKYLVNGLTLATVLMLTIGVNTAQAGVCKRLVGKPTCIDSKDVKDNSLTGADLLDGSLTGADILDGSLTTADIIDNVVTSADIQENTLTAADQSDEAGADFSSANTILDNVGTNVVVHSVTITAPTAGQVIVNASGVMDFDDGAAAEFMNCSITTGTVVDSTLQIEIGESAADSGMNFIPFAGTRGFVVAAGSTTVNLVCTGSGTMDINDPSLTAIFVPTTY